jgi:hypothetical protein
VEIIDERRNKKLNPEVVDYKEEFRILKLKHMEMDSKIEELRKKV